MKRIVGIMICAFAAIAAANAQTAQERYEEFRRKATNDYERFRDEALNRYESFMEQAWQEYAVFAGKERHDAPKPMKQPTVSEKEKEDMLAEGKEYQTMVAKPETTNAWFENLQWEGSRLEQWVDKSVDQLRNVNIKMPTAIVTLSDVARERRKAIAERIRKMGTISEDYVAPSELRRAKKLLAEKTAKDSEKTVEKEQPNVVQNEEEQVQTIEQETGAKEKESIQAATVDKKIDFELYGLQLSIPAPEIASQTIKIAPNVVGAALEKQVVGYWKKIKATDMDAALESLTEASLLYHLGHWCTFKAVEKYATTWAEGNEAAKSIMMQYLMTNMGYDVRLAVSEDKVILLLPFEQEIYGMSYIPIAEKNYYIYPSISISSLFTANIPKSEKGDRLNMVQTQAVALPRDNKTYTVEYEDLHISGDLNLNIIRMQQEFPLMDVPCYAASIHDDTLRLNIINQLKEQLKDLAEEEAANALLHFVENGFAYKTDRDQFGEGVEKPFFFEEILYHPYCDCEDRSIFYSYLVKQVLGLDVVLVHFPGHACTAVAFNNPPSRRTVTYTYKGRRYYICDPTYIIADVGMCMPSFVDITPTFMEWYGIEEKKM